MHCFDVLFGYVKLICYVAQNYKVKEFQERKTERLYDNTHRLSALYKLSLYKILEMMGFHSKSGQIVIISIQESQDWKMAGLLD